MNLNVDSFNYITGIATLIGLLFQFKDVFPEHRETRKTVVVLVTGIFVGTLISTARGIKVEMGGSIQTSQVVVFAVVCVLVLACIVVLFTNDQARRNDIYPLIAGGVIVVLVIMFGQAIASAQNSNTERELNQVSLEEIMQLANAASLHGNYQRALLWLDSAKSRVASDTEQLQSIEKREQDIRKKQLGQD